MNIVETAVPIPIENLKLYFENKETSYLIDYEKSELKGQKLLVYLSNLEIPCDIVNYDHNLIVDYLEFNMIVRVPSLEQEVLNLLAAIKMGKEVDEIALELGLQWIKKIESLTLFNMYTVESEEFKEFVTSFPEDDTKDLTGINFVSLLDNPDTYQLMANINKDNLTYYSSYFNDYMFKGQNLYSFWANENNPMFLLTWGISTGEAHQLRQVKAVT